MFKKIYAFFGGHVHEWTPWHVFKEGALLAKSEYAPWEKRTIGFCIVQKRTCTTCGKTEMETKNAFLD